MLNKEIIKYSLRNLKKRKTRSFLTILSIMFGIATITIFVSFGFAFFSFTGMVVNFSFYWNLGLLAIFGWWLFDYIDVFSETFNTSFKKMMIICFS